MLTKIFVFIALCVGLTTILIVFFKKSKDTSKYVVYVCSECGERDCTCNQGDVVK